MNFNNNISKYISGQTSIAPLAVFRVLFGFIMLVSIGRFALKGWIYEQYVKPEFYFSYLGFEWVQPLGEYGMYALFLVMGLSALGIMLGSFYRLASALFFLSFTYVELIDKTNYLNHYYFVSIIAFLLMLVPAHRRFSLDVLRYPDLGVDTVPAWTVNIFKLQLAIVYFYAGAAKLNPDWLFNAMPLRLWLPAQANLPLIGWLFDYTASAYLFSWAGALYDLTIVLFLLYRPTRTPAYITVIVFHMVTWLLFPIGMFPFIMILSTLIFFSAEFHESAIRHAQKIGHRMPFAGTGTGAAAGTGGGGSFSLSPASSSVLGTLLVLHFILQLLLPLRFTLYPGNLFWTEQGYRFSWRVMLMEKAGHATFTVTNPDNGNSWQVSNYEHLTPVQEKMMATQPDMILQFAHHLEDRYRKQGIGDVKITVDARVTLNGRRSRLMIDPGKDLTEVESGLTHKEWILPYPEHPKSWIGQQ